MALKTRLIAALALCVAFSTFGEMVSREDAERGAGRWLANNAIARATLSGRTVKSVDARGRLWVVRLDPAGYIVLSGSDLCRPVVGFSANPFAEPEPGSAFESVLSSADADAEKVETGGSASGRNMQWVDLLGNRDGTFPTKLRMVDVPQNAIVVEPFATMHWSQWRPYNDFCPVYNASDTSGSYRGRCPCGCVATVLSQLMYYWQWPRRLVQPVSYNNVYNNSGLWSFPLRFDGREDFAWNQMQDSYEIWGDMAESVRFPVARLLLLADIWAQVTFKSGGTSANMGTACSGASEWYAQAVERDTTGSNYQDVRGDIYADLAYGAPVPVTIPGHAIFAHGWASDSNDDYVYVNYGWGGSDDGWLPLRNGSGDSRILTACTGFRPRKMVQLKTLPAVSGSSVTLEWDMPAKYNSSVTGFAITATPSGSSVGDWSYGEDWSVPSLPAVVHSIPGSVSLTSRSVLTYRINSSYMYGAMVEVQGSFNGGEWQTLSAPSLNLESPSSAWSNVRVFLGDHGGSDVKLRYMLSRTSGTYYPSGSSVNISDLAISDVVEAGTPANDTASAAARSYTFNGLTAGASYNFTVTPLFAGNDGVAGEASTIIAGTRQTARPGAESLVAGTKTWTSTTTDTAWSLDGTAYSTTVFCTGQWNGGISLAINGQLSSDSQLTFGWTVNQYYNSKSYDHFEVCFTEDGEDGVQLWSIDNTSAKTNRQNVTIPLSSVAGKKGVLSLIYTHPGSAYSQTGYLAHIYDFQVTGVQEPQLPEFIWESTTFATCAAPEFVGVSGQSTPVQNGFFRENALGTNIIFVQCSASAVSLEARPSHLALLDDEDIEVKDLGNGRFAVLFDASGVGERSRMILTLIASNANGDRVYKDLSLRFSADTDEEVWTDPSDPTYIVMQDPVLNEVQVPISWFAENGLVSSGADAAACAAVATADADGDGLSNWAEYVCGTDPNDADEKLQVTISMVNGSPVVDYSPKGTILSGFKAVIKGKASLTSGDWQVKTTSHRFFRAFIERD